MHENVNKWWAWLHVTKDRHIVDTISYMDLSMGDQVTKHIKEQVQFSMD